jgi:ubiquinone/menaquinone biosynthesis C-methylase UbiE
MNKRIDPTIYFFPEIEAGGFSRVDSTVQFYERVNALVKPEFVILDFGAGRGSGYVEHAVRYQSKLRNFKGRVREVIGADVDPVVTKNPMLDRAIVLDKSGSIPLPDESVDMIISDFTFEHIEDPSHTTTELDRILVQGGWICARMPNKYGYVAVASQLVPQSFHLRLLRFVQPTSRDEQDVFRTFYRLNTFAAVRKYFKPTKYDHFAYSWDAEPAYHANYRSIFWLLRSIHTLTPPRLRTLLLVFLRKKKVK